MFLPPIADHQGLINIHYFGYENEPLGENGPRDSDPNNRCLSLSEQNVVEPRLEKASHHPDQVRVNQTTSSKTQIS